MRLVREWPRERRACEQILAVRARQYRLLQTGEWGHVHRVRRSLARQPIGKLLGGYCSYPVLPEHLLPDRAVGKRKRPSRI